jgi:nucleoside phosphorylase
MNNEDWTAYHSREDMIISPRRGKNEKTIPPSGVLLVNPGDARVGHAEIIGAGGESRPFFHSNLSIGADNRLFIAGPAVGAPVAAMTVEKLIALGAKSIYLLSWCGAISPKLKVGDIVIGGLPLSGEGTSQYYTCDLPAVPSPTLADRLDRNVQALGDNSVHGKIWSTDAPYRESRGYLEKIWKDQGIVGVDMEYSALCAVCTFRRVQFAGIFLVSDELWGEKWRPGFKNPEFLARGRRLIAMLLSGHMHSEN